MRTHDDPSINRVDPPRRERTEKPAHREVGPHGKIDAALHTPASILHLQRTAGNAAVEEMIGGDDRSPVLDVVGHGGGQALDTAVRSDMEAHLGSNLGDVRIHTGADAAQSAKAVQAKAYTVGSDIVFNDGAYAPTSPEGKHTLAHELTHVVQQRFGPVSGTDTGSGIALSDPSDSFERAAEASADRFMTGGPTSASGANGGAGAGPATAQREVPSGLAVQRAEDEKESEPVSGSEEEEKESEEEYESAQVNASEPVTGSDEEEKQSDQVNESSEDEKESQEESG